MQYGDRGQSNSSFTPTHALDLYHGCQLSTVHFLAPHSYLNLWDDDDVDDIDDYDDDDGGGGDDGNDDDDNDDVGRTDQVGWHSYQSNKN